MVVQQVSSLSEFDSVISKGITIVDYFATWCGPCRRIAPFLEELSTTYAGIKFIKVDADQAREVIDRNGIRAFPTFHVFVDGVKKEEIRGANEKGLEDLCKKWQSASGPGVMEGTGQKLGWDGVGPPPSNTKDAREAFLAKFGAPSQQPVAAPTEDSDAELAEAIALSLKEAGSDSTPMIVESMAAPPPTPLTAEQDTADDAAARAEVDAAMEVWDGEEMVPLPVDEAMLKELMDMGFSDVRSRKGIHHGKTVEGAITWISENENNEDIDQPYMVKKKDAIPKVPLTPEEYAARVKETKEKIVKLRAVKAEQDKADALAREKERRERGKTLASTQEERDRLQRKREIEKAKKEKDDAKREKERILAQIKADKAIRKANNGKLHSVLGVDGYNPSVVQMGGDGGDGTGTASSTPASAPVKEVAPPGVRVDKAIGHICRHRTGGDGGNCLKVLILFIKNIVEKPTDEKYRSINAESKAFIGKVKPITGGAAILTAVGFEKDEAGAKYLLKSDADMTLLKETLDKLVEAEKEFKKRNPV